jgi:hypothetical protein
MGTTVRPKAITSVGKLRIIDGTQNRLGQSIHNRRYPKSSGTPTRLRDQNLLHRLGLVLSSQQLSPNPRPVFLQVTRQIMHGHSVDARVFFVGLRPAPSAPSIWASFSPMPVSVDEPSPIPSGLHPQGLKEGLLLTKKVAASLQSRISEPRHRLHVRPFVPLLQN